MLLRYMKVGRRASIKLLVRKKKKKSAHAHFNHHVQHPYNNLIYHSI